MPLGGLVSGFFGGLSGMQGALRSAFLSRAGLTKEAFIATGVVIACLIDFSRLAIYSAALARESAHFNYGLLAAAVLAAFAGEFVAVTLFVVASVGAVPSARSHATSLVAECCG